MATTIDEIQVLIRAQADNFQSQISKVNKQLDSLQSHAASGSSKISAAAVAAGGVIAQAFTAAFRAVSASMDAAVSRVDTLNNFPKAMSNLGISSSDAQKAINYLSNELIGLPTTLDDAATSVQQFASANGNLDASAQMFLALNNAILAGGASADVQRAALEQLSQSYAKGKPDMEEWRSAMTAMPAQLKQVAMAMGYASANDLGEALRSGKVSMNEFMATLVRLNNEGANGFQSFSEQARNSTGGIQTSITNLKTAFTRGLANIIDVIGQTNIAGFFNTVAGVIGTAANYVAAFVKVVLNAINAIRALFGQPAIQFGKVQSSASDASAAVAGVGDAASGAAGGIDDATKAAKKLNQQLAGFDEMNVLRDQSSSGSGGGSGGSGGGADMGSLNIPPIDAGNITNQVDEIAKKIQNAFENAFNAISKSKTWSAIVKSANKVWKSISTNANKAFTNISKIAQTTYNAVSNTFAKYGASLDAGFASAVLGLGDLMSSGVDLMWAPLNGFLEGFNSVWQTAAQSVTDSLAQIVISVSESFGQITSGLSTTINGIIQYVQGSFVNLGGLMAQMFTDWITALGEWAPLILENFTAFFENINTGLFQPYTQLIGQVWQDFTKSLWDWWNKYGSDITNGVMQFIDGLVGWFNQLWTQILEPIVKPFLEQFRQTWENSIRPCVEVVEDFVGKLISNALKIWNEFIQPIVNWLTGTFGPAFVTVGNVISGAFNTVVSFISNAINSIMTILGGIIDFITGVFTGDWSQAWEGVKSIFQGIADGIGNAFKAPINFIIDIINGFISGLNNIKIPDWVPAVGGKGFNIPKLNKLAKGGIVSRATIAMVGESGREAVLPLENNTGWIRQLAQDINETNGVKDGGDASTPINVVVKIGEDTIIDKVIDGINGRSFLDNRSAISV